MNVADKVNVLDKYPMPVEVVSNSEHGSVTNYLQNSLKFATLITKWTTAKLLQCSNMRKR